MYYSLEIGFLDVFLFGFFSSQELVVYNFKGELIILVVDCGIKYN